MASSDPFQPEPFWEQRWKGLFSPAGSASLPLQVFPLFSGLVLDLGKGILICMP